MLYWEQVTDWPVPPYVWTMLQEKVLDMSDSFRIQKDLAWVRFILEIGNRDAPDVVLTDAPVFEVRKLFHNIYVVSINVLIQPFFLVLLNLFSVFVNLFRRFQVQIWSEFQKRDFIQNFHTQVWIESQIPRIKWYHIRLLPCFPNF